MTITPAQCAIGSRYNYFPTFREVLLVDGSPVRYEFSPSVRSKFNMPIGSPDLTRIQNVMTSYAESEAQYHVDRGYGSSYPYNRGDLPEYLMFSGTIAPFAYTGNSPQILFAYEVGKPTVTYDNLFVGLTRIDTDKTPVARSPFLFAGINKSGPQGFTYGGGMASVGAEHAQWINQLLTYTIEQLVDPVANSVQVTLSISGNGLTDQVSYTKTIALSSRRVGTQVYLGSQSTIDEWYEVGSYSWLDNSCAGTGPLIYADFSWMEV
jgi:hypothetical protein